jgi:hypothetical protein
MVIIGLMAMLFYFVRRRDTDTGIVQGVGYTWVQLRFYVCDAESGRPVEATISLMDLDWADETDEPHLILLKTGHDGSASKSLKLPFAFTQGVPSKHFHSLRLSYPPWQMRVEADGCAGVTMWFRDYEVGDKRFHENRPPPVIVSRLRRSH